MGSPRFDKDSHENGLQDQSVLKKLGFKRTEQKMGGHGLKTDFGFSSLVTFIFYIFLLLLFAIQLMYCIDKFLDKNTTDVTKIDYQNSVDIPAITICRQCYKNFTPVGLENELLVTMDTMCLEILRSVIPGLNTTSMPTNASSTLDSADVWNRCLRERYHSRQEVIEKINFASEADFFWKNLSNQSDDSQVDFIPFFSKYGHCYTMRPQYNKTMKTNKNESNILIKVQPGIYTIMIHDQSIIPVSTGMQDIYRIVPKELVIPNSNLSTGTLQYAPVSMKEKLLIIPTRISKNWFGSEKKCRDNLKWYESFEKSAVKYIGCQLDFHKWQNASSSPNCKTRQEMNNYFNLMGEINTMNSKDMSQKLNLPPLCVSRVIEATLEAKLTTSSGGFAGISVKSGTNQTGNFLLFYYSTARIQIIEDTHFYEGSSLVGDVGGSLFLFLSVSIAHIIKVLRMGGKKLMNKKHL